MAGTRSTVWLMLVAGVLLVAAGLVTTSASPAAADTSFDVDTTDDLSLGDGADCTDGSGPCSLRAALQQAADVGGDVAVQVPAGHYQLTLGALEVLRPLDDQLLVDGAGADATVIDADGLDDRVLRVTGNVRLSGVTLTGGFVTDDGGGLRVEAGDTTLERVVVRENAALNGGGISNGGGTLRLVESTVAINAASGTGGGIDAFGSGGVELVRSTIDGNLAEGSGGGLWANGEAVVVDTSTITGNQAGDGGGGLRTGAGGLTLRASTVTGNEAGAGGGGIRSVFDSSTLPAALLHGNVVAGNTVDGDPQACFVFDPGFFTSAGGNIVDDDSCGLDATGDQQGVDAGLGELADHGGPTRTHALAPDSPARNAAGDCNSAEQVTDQRGVARPQGPACDAGAFELGFGTVAVSVHDAVTGDPIVGARVSTDDGREATTGGDGQARVTSVREGQRTVDARADGHLPTSAEVTVAPDETADVQLALQPTGARRVGGGQRFATAALLSAQAYPDGAEVAYLASGQDFPDALAGGVPAARDAGPVLLTARTSLPGDTVAELRRLDADRVVVLGGTAAVAESVVGRVRDVTGADVSRLAGADRFVTAARVATATFPDGADTVLVATGADFPDALAGVPAASAYGGPLLLTLPDRVPGATADALAALDPDQVIVLGGRLAVSDDAAEALAHAADAEAFRLAGGDRFSTAAAIADLLWADGSDRAFLATGTDFPDALAGGAVAAARDEPVLLTAPDALPPSTRTSLRRLGATTAVLLGGPGAVADVVLEQIHDELRGS